MFREFGEESAQNLHATRRHQPPPHAPVNSQQDASQVAASTASSRNEITEIEQGLMSLTIAASAGIPLPRDLPSSPSALAPAMGPPSSSTPSSSSSSSSDRLSILPPESLGCPTRSSPTAVDPPSAPRHGDKPVGILYDESMERHTGPGRCLLQTQLINVAVPLRSRFHSGLRIINTIDKSFTLYSA